MDLPAEVMNALLEDVRRQGLRPVPRALWSSGTRRSLLGYESPYLARRCVLSSRMRQPDGPHRISKSLCTKITRSSYYRAAYALAVAVADLAPGQSQRS